MHVYSTEDEQVEALRKWWQENGKSAIFGVVLGLGAIFGWRAWQDYSIHQAEAASAIYQEALVAMNQDQPQQARDAALRVVNEYADTGYSVFARLILAHVASEEQDYNAATQYLTAARDQAENESLRHEITLRLARAHVANGKLDEALSLVNNVPEGAYSAPYNELKGDVLARQNKNAEARQAYEAAIAASQASPMDLGVLNTKLNSLGK